jgi:hypothetical protein
MSSNRLQVSYENRSSSFYRTNQEFKKQFCHIYASRLRRLGSELLRPKAQKKFGECFKILSLQVSSLSSFKPTDNLIPPPPPTRHQTSLQEDLRAQRRQPRDLHHHRNLLQRPSSQAKHSQRDIRGQSTGSTATSL